jgi:hypothetical protein
MFLAWHRPTSWIDDTLGGRTCWRASLLMFMRSPTLPNKELEPTKPLRGFAAQF